MAIDLININNIVLADDFETWLDRTNEVIDALNPLQLYDFYDNFYNTGDGVAPTIPGYTGLADLTEATTLGLKITRDIRFLGDMLIEIIPEAPLGFNSITGRLAFVFTGPNAPPLLGTSCSPPDRVERNDLFIVYDFDANVTKIVEAEDMLPPIIRCDHQFGEIGTPVTITIKGDLVVDGTQTILSTTNVSSLDNNIELNALNALELIDNTNYVSGEDFVNGESVSGQTTGTSAQVVSWTPAPIGNPGSVLVVTNTAGVFVDGEDVLGGTGGALITIGSQAPPIPTLAAGDDTIANNGGICLLSTDLFGGYCIRWKDTGDRWFVNDAGWEVDQNFNVFTTAVETQTGVLDLQGGGGGPYPLIVSMRSTIDPNFPGSDDHWEFRHRANPTVLPFGYPLNNYPIGGSPFLVDEGTFVLVHVASLFLDVGGAILFDTITPTHDPLIVGFARNLNADLLDGCHSNQTPTPFNIPCAGATGEIDPGWIPFTGSTVKEINQTAHGFIPGNVVRIDKINPFGYVLALADNNNLAFAEAVGVVENVIDNDNFELNLRGCIEATTVEWDAVTDDVGPGLTPGAVYFLSDSNAGEMTQTEPTPGGVSKTMMVAIDSTTAIVMNYVGGLTDPTSGVPAIELTNDVLAIGLLGSPLVTSIVERTSRQTAVGGTLPLVVQDNDSGSGNRTFEITMTANTTLELQQPGASLVDPVTNSVTLIIHQDGTGGWTPNITISGGGTIAWDNSVAQPAAQTTALKTTLYVLVNVNDVPGVWYGSRAVFEL